KFFSQFMQRLNSCHTFPAEPRCQRVEMPLRPVMGVARTAPRLRVGLNYKRAGSFCMPAPKQSRKLFVDRHIASAIGSFWCEMFRCLDSDNTVFPSERRPLELIDLIAPQAGHRRQQKYFQLLLRQFAHGVLNECLNIECTMITLTLPLIKIHALKWHPVRQ